MADAAATTPAQVAPDVEMTPKDAPAAPAQETPAAPAPPPAPPAPVAPEPPKELEVDAVGDKRPKISEEVAFPASDMTLNVLPSTYGNLFMPLTDGGMQFLLGGVRANCGLKAGRYFFEAKIIELSEPADQSQAGRPPLPRQLLRIGFSTAGSSLFLGDSEDSVCFDSEGRFTSNRKQSPVSQRFVRDQVIGVVLNLGDGPNANTVSLFRDGVRVSPPQPLPENLKGKALFPTLTFRNVTVSVNCGPKALTGLPFDCRMIGDAASKDVELVKQKVPADGKYQVVFPVCLPDEGSFDWLDMWLEQNPDFTELSDRKILEWAEKSGVVRQKGYTWRTSNDKPEMNNFGISQLDDQSIKKMLRTIASSHKRNFVVMELRGNLLAASRKELLSAFTAPHFKPVAQVVMGDAPADFKKMVQATLLKQKQEKADTEFKMKKAQEKIAQLQVLKAKELAREQRKRERVAKKAEKEAKKAAEKAAEAAKKAEGGEGEAAKPDEEMKEAEDPDEDDKEEEKEDAPMPDPTEEKPPAVTLTEEEKKMVFRKTEVPDMLPATLSACFATFTIPEKSEGFEEVNYSWSKAGKADTYMKEWQLAMKLSTPVQDLKPSEWFTKHSSSWQTQLQKWQNKLLSWKASVAKKDSSSAEAEKKESVEAPAEGAEGAEGEEKKPEEPKKAEEPKKDVQMASDNDDDLDVFGVADICDIGDGEPLFSHFSFADWALVTLRVELHLMTHSFRKDVADLERPGVQVDNFPFYYNRYFKKTFNAKNYGVESATEVVGFVQDTVTLTDKSVLQAHLDEELDNFDLFLKLTEEARRERELLVDAGDDSAILKFNQTSLGAMTGGSSGNQGRRDNYRRDGQKGGAQGKGFGGPSGKGFGGPGNWGQQQQQQGQMGNQMGQKGGGGNFGGGNYGGGYGKGYGGQQQQMGQQQQFGQKGRYGK
eukprot:CAMPEP_0115120122 /NCGR_PEP_ID=MMETSP0227-20121206/45498_1 /TAXON_ID=89957 /ORGANISM="Polarella glacialis, Strain CCMP 1383" /LENGTH=934 /DNA_ID=CAMNT_0002521721 /DNA_START=70 /DNA_END=2874 /DNA_ORIENTATION=+